MKKFYLIIVSALIGSSFLNAQDCTELFFSEYVEGTDNSKAIEIYNPTDKIVDLSNYYVARYSNGASNYDGGGITQLQGFLTAKDVFILVNGQTEDLAGSTKCSPELQAKADMLDHAYPAPMYMNGNDAIALLKDPTGDGVQSEFIAIDLFGTIGGGMNPDDEGWTNFTDGYAFKNVKDLNGDIIGKDSIYITNYIAPAGWFWLPWTANHTLIRKVGIQKGALIAPGTAFNLTAEWDTLSGVVNDWSNLGVHDCKCSWAVGVSSTQEISKLTIFPNPAAEGVFTLSTYKPFLSYEIRNSLGQIVSSHSSGQNNLNSRITIEENVKGLFFIKVKFSDSESITEKLIIQ